MSNFSLCQITIPHVSELFNQISSNPFQEEFDSRSIYNIYATSDSVLFVVNRKGFDNQTCKGYAKFTKINAFTGLENTYLIPPSKEFIEKEGKIAHIWIWALAASNSIIALAVDDGVWIYKLTESKQYEYIINIPLQEVRHLEIVNNDLHAFVEKSDGFDWYRINLIDYKIKKIRQLTLKNPFFLQIAPAKVITIQNEALYLLQQHKPCVEKYSLTGNLIAMYKFNIPNWNPIPNEIVQKLDSIVNITDRNYAFVQYGIFDYNFMHLFYVFSNERFFLVAVDKNPHAGTYVTPYFAQIAGDTTLVDCLSVKLNENEVFEKNKFPFSTAGGEGNLIFAQSNRHIIQINKSTTVSWHNKTQNEYKKEVNLYHRDNNPVNKIETYQLTRDYLPIDSIFFLDYDDLLFPINNIKSEKAVFIISKNPQCSACIKSLWNLFSNTTILNSELYNVSSDCPTYLLKKESTKEVSSFLKKEYTPLFIDTKKLNATTTLLLNQKSSPMVMLFDKRLQHMELYSSRYIISDYFGNMNSLFIEAVNNFVGK